jgi:hypothetical protein
VFFRAVVLARGPFSFRGVGLLRMSLIEVDHFFVNSGGGECFARQQLDRGNACLAHRSRTRRFPVSVPVFVVLKIFEYVAYIQEGVAIEADVDECRLHAGEYPRHFSLVDAPDKRELFFALDVDLN